MSPTLNPWPPFKAEIRELIDTAGYTATLRYNGRETVATASNLNALRTGIIARAAAAADVLGRPIALEVTERDTTTTFAVHGDGVVQLVDPGEEIPDRSELEPVTATCLHCGERIPVTTTCCPACLDPDPLGLELVAPAAEPVPTLPTHAEETTTHSTSKRSKRALVLCVAGIAVVAIGGISTAAALSAPGRPTAPSQAPQKPSPKPTAPAEPPHVGWALRPAWTLTGPVDRAVESADGRSLAALAGEQVRIVDQTTGTVLSTQQIPDATGAIYRAGGMILVEAKGALWSWAAGAEWRRVDVDAKTRLKIRGSAALLVRKAGADYRLIRAGAAPLRIAVPTAGAVPIASAGSTIVWGTNRGRAWSTSTEKAGKRSAALKAPAKKLTKILRWIDGDSTHVYVIWGDKRGGRPTLAVHDLRSGRAIASAPFAGEVTSTVAIATRDGSAALVNGHLVDAGTGKITAAPTGTPAVPAPLGAGYVYATEAGWQMLTPDGQQLALVDDSAQPIGSADAQQLVVLDQGKLVALTRDGAPGEPTTPLATQPPLPLASSGTVTVPDQPRDKQKRKKAPPPAPPLPNPIPNPYPNPTPNPKPDKPVIVDPGD